MTDRPDLSAMTLAELQQRIAGKGHYPPPSPRDFEFAAALATRPSPPSYGGETVRVRRWLCWYFNLRDKQLTDMLLGYFVSLNLAELSEQADDGR